jgi:hypothetical protein
VIRGAAASNHDQAAAHPSDPDPDDTIHGLEPSKTFDAPPNVDITRCALDCGANRRATDDHKYFCHSIACAACENGAPIAILNWVAQMSGNRDTNLGATIMRNHDPRLRARHG